MNAGAPLSAAARADLLGLARQTLEAHFAGRAAPRLSSDRAESFGEPRGLFVTLHKEGRLRGCIGTLTPHGDLTRVISEYALRAAFEDPRFPPLAAPELPECAIEISVLGAPREIRGPEDLEIGKDGVILEAKGRRGLLLPQVASEHGFDAGKFLEEVSRKAGLPPDAWQSAGARTWAFRAEVFAE